MRVTQILRQCIKHLVDAQGITWYWFWKDLSVSKDIASRLYNDETFIPSTDVMEKLFQCYGWQPEDYLYTTSNFDITIPGELRGLKRGLLQGTPEQRIEKLQEVMKYGKAGVDVVAAILEDKAIDVRIRDAAYGLLKDSADARVKQAIAEYCKECCDTYSRDLDEQEHYMSVLESASTLNDEHLREQYIRSHGFVYITEHLKNARYDKSKG